MRNLLTLCFAALCLPVLTAAHAEPRIVGGRSATPGSMPWLVAVADAKPPAKPLYDRQFCGGALIADNWVLTAAHCVEGTRPESLQVVAQIYDLTKDSGQVSAVRRKIMHPNYNRFSMNADIALLELATPLDAIPIPVLQQNLALTGQWLSIAGWGSIDKAGNNYAEQLRETEVPIVSNATCQRAYGRLDKITGNMLCAGFKEGGRDSCQGDSGGPALVEINGRWLLAGVVSFGEGCARANYYGIYTRVSRFAAFLHEYVDFDGNRLADVNQDGRVNAADAIDKNQALQDEFDAWLEDCWKTRSDCGDVDGDKNIDWRDVLRRNQYMDGLWQAWTTEYWQPLRD
ncbi:MAG: trypsin-like serine protease [Methylococcaceae bacterium]|nr:MAG: trypsin-like serine protease [Methylococcaceae bacterium]